MLNVEEDIQVERLELPVFNLCNSLYQGTIKIM